MNRVAPIPAIVAINLLIAIKKALSIPACQLLCPLYEGLKNEVPLLIMFKLKKQPFPGINKEILYARKYGWFRSVMDRLNFPSLRRWILARKNCGKHLMVTSKATIIQVTIFLMARRWNTPVHTGWKIFPGFLH